MSSLTKIDTGTLPPVAAKAYITFEEYLERSSETRINEWVDGEIMAYRRRSILFTCG